MSWIFFLVGLCALAASIFPVLLARRFVSDIQTALRDYPDPGYRPKVSLIIPCKGLDPDFETNINAFLAQDYPDLEFFFITATTEDPAHAALADIIRHKPEVSANLLVAGIIPGRSQKINNQLKAIGEIGQSSEVFVFMDSDARPDPAFVRHLIQPLREGRTGLATGFRWYMPVRGGLWSMLRSAWNGGGVVFLPDPQANYAWGGAMAIRRETFESCKVAERWQNALSDDMTITLAVREKGMGITFVPHCLVTTHEDCTFSQMLEWTNRQTTIARVYHPALWWKIALAHCVGNAVLFLGLGLLAWQVAAGFDSMMILSASLMMLSIVPMEMLNAQILMPAIAQMLPAHREQLEKQLWMFRLLAPLASLLALYNTVYSLFTRRITWRGITYEMRSPTETIVISE
jgi:cellulose synthase/poly-beta-1,6-N-acetylglucosamine synthase-like glycosyltransferase